MRAGQRRAVRRAAAARAAERAGRQTLGGIVGAFVDRRPAASSGGGERNRGHERDEKTEHRCCGVALRAAAGALW